MDECLCVAKTKLGLNCTMYYYTTIQRFEVSKGFCKQMNTLIQLECIKLLESDRKDTYTVTIKIQFQINSVHLNF